MPTPGDFSGSPPNIPSFPSGGSPAPAAPPAAPAPSPGGANTQYVQQKPLPVRPKGSNKLKEKYVENKKKPVNENGEKIREASQSKTTKITKQKDNYRYRNVKQNKFEQPRMSVRVRPGYYNVNIISRKHDIIWHDITPRNHHAYREYALTMTIRREESKDANMWSDELMLIRWSSPKSTYATGSINKK